MISRILLLPALLAIPLDAQITVDSTNFTYTQNFNTLPTTASTSSSNTTWANNSTIAGWSIFAGDGGNVGYTPNNLALPISVSNIRTANGSSGSDRANTNYGSVNSPDRAIGFQTGSTHRYADAFTNITDSPPSIFGFVSVSFLNQTSSTLSGFDATYTGEQWRYGAAASSPNQRLDFEYAIASAATPASNLVWIAPTPAEAKAAGAHFTSIINSGSSRALDGNNAANRVTGLGATVEGIAWSPGHVLHLRWYARNHASSDNGLAIDDFEFEVLVGDLPTVTMTAPADAAEFDAPSSISLAANATAVSGATIAKVEFYRGGIFVGEDDTAPFESSWATPFNGTHTFTAVAEDDLGRRAASAPITITVTGQPTVPPSVTITAPANDAVFDAPATFTFAAAATDSDGVVTHVEFFVDGIKVGESTAPPHEVQVGPLFTGNYTLAATATDDGGATTTDEISVLVENNDNILPTVSITFPLDGATLYATSANLSAIAADTDGFITKVEFFSGSGKLGEATSAPFTFEWTGIAAGPYTITAVATDNDGGTTTSAPVNVTFDDSATFSYSEDFNSMGTGTSPPTGWNHFGALGGSNSSWTNSTGIPASGFPSAATPGTLNNTLIVTSNAATGTVNSNTQAYNAALAESTANRALATAPTSGTGNILQLTLENTATKAITRLDVGYDIRRFRSVGTANELPGYWLFYSLDNGATWTNVAELNPLLSGTLVNVPNNVGVTEVRNHTIFLNSPWPVGSEIRFRWVDDNATETSPDQFIGLDNVTLAASGFLTGIAPTASITSPVDGAVFPANPTILIEATASDSGGVVELVEFFANGVKIGEAETAPYTFAWVSPAPGSYTLTARATDDDGDFSSSAPVSVTVQAPPGIVAGPWVGAVTHESAIVAVALTASDVNTRVILSTSADLSNPVFSDTVVSSNAFGNSVKISLTGLAPLTTYHYAIEINGVAQTSGDLQGKFSTFPTPGPASYRFAFGSCGSYSNASQFVYEGIVKDNPLFFIHMGDMNYRDINSTNPDHYRVVYNEQITIGQLRRVCRAMGMAYMWDDHDYAGNDSNKNNIGRTATRQVYRERFPHYDLPAGGPDEAIYQAFSVGRVRYILTDLRSERDPISQADDASKSMMGAVQKAWFKQQLINARDAEVPLIVWNSSVPFISTSTSGDNWGRFQTERREILEFIRDERIQNIVIISGDMHALSLDDGQGTNAYVAGVRIPVFHGAALAQSGSTKGGPYRVGANTISPSSGLGRFGILDLSDDGANLSAVFRGRITSGSGADWTSTADWQFLTGQTSFTYNAEPVRPRKAINPAATPALDTINITWVDDSNVETGYRIERSPAGSNDFASIGSVSANNTAFADTSAVPGAAYDYRVIALNQSIEADPSQVATATAFTSWENFKLEKTGGIATDPLHDSGDNDGLALLLEFAFGLNPNAADNRALDAGPDGVQILARGTPVVFNRPHDIPATRKALFIRRVPAAGQGFAYTCKFSRNLEEWNDATGVPQVLAEADGYQLMGIDFEEDFNFFRLELTPQP